jgi:heterotetrameric sarcosine oxidase gamma subunit
MPEEAVGIQLETCETDIVEIAAQRGRAGELQTIARGRGLALPALGRASVAADQLALCVRPERWLLLTPPASPGATAQAWRAACVGVGAAIDLSSGLTALQLAGRTAREVLVRACRLDLDRDAFPVGAAAATIMVQVSVTLAVLPSGLLLLTPASTARHLREWLSCTAKPFGLMPPSDLTVAARSADPRS